MSSAHPRIGSGTGSELVEGPNQPAGFWWRYAAWSLDAALIALPVLLLAWRGLVAGFAPLGAAIDTLSTTLASMMIDGLQTAQSPLLLAQRWLHDPALREAVAALQSALGTMLLPPLGGFIALALVSAVVFERSSWQATPGKRALGLAVVDDAGRRLAAGHALLRFCAGALSWLTLNLGHALAALPPRHLALHDRVSGTRVLRPDAARSLPRWAQAWLALQLCAFAVANVWALRALYTAMQVAIDRAL